MLLGGRVTIPRYVAGEPSEKFLDPGTLRDGRRRVSDTGFYYYYY